MDYLLMRKNDPITYMRFSETGAVISWAKNIAHTEIAPMQFSIYPGWLSKWWDARSIPIKQGEVDRMLQERGLLAPKEYLLKNLGLSLMDYYWIKPIDSELTWEQVNLFENDFKDNLFMTDHTENPISDSYTPNSSLQGNLEKSWAIDGEGKRILMKGNRQWNGADSCQLSAESINEVIASEVHRLQGYDNYTPYELIPLPGKPYDYGCFSRAFTSLDRELVSAHAVVTSQKQRNDVSSYEHFIAVCGAHGIDKERLRADLEYQILTDFVLSGRDRHLSNVSILRDANTLQFIRMAPIYDSGKCLFVDMPVPVSDKELLSMGTNSFASTELKLLKYITMPELVDVTRLPSPTFIREMYSKDSHMTTDRIQAVVNGYERKIDKLRDFQKGVDLTKLTLPGVSIPQTN